MFILFVVNYILWMWGPKLHGYIKYFHSLELIDRGNKAQLQVSRK